MTPITVRPAGLDDVQAISRLFCERVDVWQRLSADGRAEAIAYDDLTIYERWLHGVTMNAPAWMCLETGSLWLSYLLRRQGIALVAEFGGRVAGYVEAFPADEPSPYGKNLHLMHLIGDDTPVREQMLAAMGECAAKRRLTVTLSSYDREAAAFYAAHGLSPLEQVEQYTVIAQNGRGFYQAVEHLKPDVQQINGLLMSAGRVQSAATHWHQLWPGIWDAIPQVRERRTHRLSFNASGHQAFVCIQQGLYTERTADVYCWSANVLTSQLLVAIRDWAYREGYRTLVFAVPRAAAKILGAEAETTPYKFDLYST